MWFVYEVIRYIFLSLFLVVIFFKSLFGFFTGACSERLRISFDHCKYHIVDNVTLKTLDGITQIDHIVVSITGVFVIEAKNMTGWVFGSERQAEWTQSISGKNINSKNLYGKTISI